MTQINWNLLGPPVNIGESFQLGLETARAARRKQQEENALAAYGQNPNDPQALAGVTALNPLLGMRLQDQAAQQQQRARQARVEEAKAKAELTERQRETIKIGARLLANVKDDASYQAARQAAERMGLDLTDVPPTFDPAYVAQVVQAGTALSDEKDKGPEVTVIDGVAFDRNTGQPLFESPYPRIISGPGGIYEQPRIGYGRQPGTAAPAGRVVQGEPPQLPPGWEIIDDDEGGPGPGGPATFP
jgi:hypothetical protein